MVSQTFRCAVCISNWLAIRAQLEQLAAADGGGELPELPPVRAAVTPVRRDGGLRGPHHRPAAAAR